MEEIKFEISKIWDIDTFNKRIAERNSKFSNPIKTKVEEMSSDVNSYYQITMTSNSALDLNMAKEYILTMVLAEINGKFQ